LLLYYITDRTQFPGGERERRERLLEKISEAAGCGVDYVQLREKDLPSRELEALARDVVARIRASGSNAHLLINSRTDVALAVGAEGVHLRSRDVSPDAVRKIWRSVRGAAASIVAVSCHTEAEVVAAEKSDADLAVFGPVFEKQGAPEMGTTGLDLLRAVCRKKIQVLALGGVTAENAVMCRDAGATGVAGVRLFQETNVAAAVAKLRG
jgi:thiamine-phosphate pyrophosphorylase